MAKPDISHKRKQIRDTVLTVRFKTKGGKNFTSLSGADVRYLFKLYDSQFFDDQIERKLASSNRDLQFRVTQARQGPICRYGSKGNNYFIEISPNVLSDWSAEDRLSVLSTVLEHNIIHLLMILWGYENKSPGDVYSPHGKLFQCMLIRYFGTKLSPLFQGSSGCQPISTNVAPIPPYPKRGTSPQIPKAAYVYYANSCYLDALLTVLFWSKSSFWRKQIMDVDIDKLQYPIVPCEAKSKIKTKAELRNFVSSVQTQIITDYKSLKTGETNLRCTPLRSLLVQCQPNMMKFGQWVMYNVGAIYNTLADLFPGLKFQIPVQITKDGRVIGDTKYQTDAMLTFWDFLDPLTDREPGENYKTILWDQIDSPILVFYNGGTPRVKILDKQIPETGSFYVNHTKHSFSITKARKFGETILDGRYRLVGVVTLNGISERGEGGTHYTAHFCGKDNKWYSYDDIRSQPVTEISSLPREGVWVEKNEKMPSLYLYVRTTQRTSPKPVMASFQQEPTEKVVGVALDYKKVRRPDGSILFFVTDKTPTASAMPKLMKLSPTTKIQDNVVFWRFTTDAEVKALEKSIQKIDSSFASPIPELLSRRTGIDSVPFGQQYTSTPNTLVYNYSDRAFAVIPKTPQDRSILVNLDGLEINRPKYGLKAGFVFPKSQFTNIMNKLHS